MIRVLLLAAAFALAGCGLRPMYSGGERGSVAAGLHSVSVRPIPGRAGWLVRVITAADDYVGDVYVEGERITMVGESLDVEADRVVDASGRACAVENHPA